MDFAIAGTINTISSLFRGLHKSAQLRAALREQLRREARYNHEVLALALVPRRGADSDDHLPTAVVLDKLRFNALDTLLKQPFPVAKVLRRELSVSANSLLSAGAEDLDGRYVRWIQGIQSESDLLERIWLRFYVASARHDLQIGQADLRYLRHLIGALEVTLRDTQ